MHGGFIECITVLDEWESSSESFRLIDKGGGPAELQIFTAGEWEEERSCYQWGVILDRLLSLRRMVNNNVK